MLTYIHTYDSKGIAEIGAVVGCTPYASLVTASLLIYICTSAGLLVWGSIKCCCPTGLVRVVISDRVLALSDD